jgi:copper chaperone
MGAKSHQPICSTVGSAVLLKKFSDPDGTWNENYRSPLPLSSALNLSDGNGILSVMKRFSPFEKRIMTEKRYTISGMSCNHCVMALRKELETVAGVEILEATVGSALLSYESDIVPESAILAAVEEAGYAVTNTEAVAG